jgi:hypothetical protein
MANIGVSPLGLTLNSLSGGSPTIGSYSKKRISDEKELYTSLFKNTGFAIYSKGTDSEGNILKSSDTTTLHDDEVYDTSIISILNESGKQQSTALSPADFAYLKNLGVFPNNRLMIARRFPGPIGNDLTSVGNTTPLSTLISWVPDGDNFISFSFGEVWDEADASFKSVLNDIGKGTMLSKDQSPKLGDFLSGGIGSIPFPGLMENLQYKVLKEMGLTDGKNTELLPGGNPNLIRRAKRRRTLDNETAGSGLNCKFSIKMTVEYELKYIDGVDPTITYFDILSNILSFATSNSIFQFNSNFAGTTNSILNSFISGDVQKITKALGSFVTALATAIKDVALDLIKKIDDITSNKNIDIKEKLLSPLTTIAEVTVGKFVNKFKVRIIGIINALTGTPSTPWHITVGNPKRPLFSSGDMYISDDVKLDLGPILQFNDLPSSIKCEFTLINARPLGAQEIYERFNNGEGRTYKRLNLSLEESDTKVVSQTSATQSAGDLFVDDQKYPRDQFNKALPKSSEDTTKAASERTGASGAIVENSGASGTSQQFSSTGIQVQPPPQEVLNEPEILAKVEYTYSATLIGNDIIRVVVSNNFFEPPIEYTYNLTQAPDTGTAIILSQNKLDSFGDYYNNIKYPKTGTEFKVG